MPYPGGGTRSVVFATLDLAWVGRHAAGDLPPGWAVALSDEGGTILARHPDPSRWVGQPLTEAPVISAALAEKGNGTAEVDGADGVVRLLGFAPLPGPAGGRRAYLSVGLPRAGALAEADRTLRRNLLGLGLDGRRWRSWRPGSGATGSSSAASKRSPTPRAGWRPGDLEARSEVAGGDEIGELARALNAMAARVSATLAGEREARHALAGRVDTLVAERTHEVELLRQLSELLQACATPEEAHAVMGQLCGRLFPDASGAVLVTPASRDGLWAVAVWGPPLAAGASGSSSTTAGPSAGVASTGSTPRARVPRAPTSASPRRRRSSASPWRLRARRSGSSPSPCPPASSPREASATGACAWP